jgi:competence protein ComEA
MNFNYLSMIRNVKIYLAKIRDGKGKEYSFGCKKNFPTKIPPNRVEKPISTRKRHASLRRNFIDMAWKQMAGEYFNFTSKDRVAILALLTLVMIVWAVPNFVHYSNNNARGRLVDSSWVAAARSLEARAIASEQETEPVSHYQYDRRPSSSYSLALRGELFYFDPNTLDAAGWKKLGLREKTTGIILNYLSKGGRFRKPEDLSRIYGLHKDEYERLAPYIQIEQPARPEYAPSAPVVSKSARFGPVDINAADTSAFIALPGIGSKLALRIVNFREKLGGFYSIAQVGETYGLMDSVFQKIKPQLQLNTAFLKKININTATIDELKQHPYIRYAIAKAIVSYRDEHGSFNKIEDIKKIMVITEEVYSKLQPYLSLEEK